MDNTVYLVSNHVIFDDLGTGDLDTANQSIANVSQVLYISAIELFIYLLYNRTRSTEHTHTKKNRPKKHKIKSYILNWSEVMSVTPIVFLHSQHLQGH